MQKGVDFEVVVAEDYSTDNTKRIIEEYEKQYPGIVKPVRRDSNVGMMENLRTALPLCSGEYVALCEGDDYWTDEYKLAKQLKALHKNTDLDVCISSGYKSFRDGRCIRSWELRKATGRLTTCDILNVKGIMAPTASFFIRKKVLSGLPGWFYECPVADSFLLLSAAKDHGVYYINEPMVVYRVESEGSWSGEQKKINVADRVRFIRGMLESYKKSLIDFELPEICVEKRIGDYKWELMIIYLKRLNLGKAIKCLFNIGFQGVISRFRD